MALPDRREQLASEAIRGFHRAADVPIEPKTTQHDIDVTTQIQSLAAAEDVVLLPEQFHGPDNVPLTRHRDDAVQVKKLLNEQGIKAALVPTDEGFLVQESIDVHLPALALSAQHILANPEVLKALLKVAADYVKDRIRGTSLFKGGCKLDITVVHPKGPSVNVTYEGPSDGLQDLAKVIEAAAKR